MLSLYCYTIARTIGLIVTNLHLIEFCGHEMPLCIPKHTIVKAIGCGGFKCK